ncbi:MAG: glycosyltransferase, partial [Bacteroidales bacterium]|nr:glycosyltransferase [Bacteroidales bacterium]
MTKILHHNMSQADSTELSVVIPTYNRSDYVCKCIHSIMACGLRNIEIIVVDDGSTDDTANAIAQIDYPVIYHWQPNTGTPSTARNQGFLHCRGRYVAFLDCDDSWLPSVPDSALQLLNRHPQVDVLFADAHMGNSEQGFTSWIDIAGQDAFLELPHQMLESNFRLLAQRPFFRRMAERNPVFIGAVILRRDVFAESGGFNPSLRGAADWELWLRLASRCTFGYLSEPMAIYSRHFDNMSSDQEHMINEFCQALLQTEQLPLLPASDREWVAKMRARQLYNYAYNTFDSGRYDLARTRFKEAIEAGCHERTARMLHAACYLPHSII